MKQKDFLKELDSRLKENKKLSENPGLGEKFSTMSSWFGLNAFWILSVVSFCLSLYVVLSGMSNVGNKTFFGVLYE